MQNRLPSMTSASIETPIGDLVVIADADGNLLMAEFADGRHRIERWLDARRRAEHAAPMTGKVSIRIEAAFAAYFAGDLSAIDDIPIQLCGTAFQNEMWAALRDVRAGTTCGYGDFAVRLGRPNAARAIGHANGANPLCVVVPCHRLVGANGALVNYGGGLHRKRWLLDHERKHAG